MAEWTRAFINDLPDSSFAVIEPAYQRGETDDKNARHLPHHGPEGGGTKNINLDLPHLRNAFARVNQIKPVTDSISTEELRSKALAHLEAHKSALESHAMEHGLFFPVDFELNTSRFKKEVLRVGNFKFENSQGDLEEFNVTLDYLKNLAENSNNFLSRGGKIYIPNRHQADPLSNAGWVENFFVEDNKLYAVLSITEPDVLEKVLRGTIQDVSIRLSLDYVDSYGNYYDKVITHVALTLEPRIPGQAPFIQMELSGYKGPKIQIMLEKNNKDSNESEGNSRVSDELLKEKQEKNMLLEKLAASEESLKQLQQRVLELENLEREAKNSLIEEKCRKFIEDHQMILTSEDLRSKAFSILYETSKKRKPDEKISLESLHTLFKDFISALPVPVKFGQKPPDLISLSGKTNNDMELDREEARKLIKKYIKA
jgi:hypothetical protein